MKKIYSFCAILVTLFTICSISSFAQNEDCVIGKDIRLPYTADFESMISFESCWERLTTLPTYIPTQSFYVSHHGNYCLDFSTLRKEGEQTIAIMPKVADDLDLSTLKLNFWLESTGDDATFEIGVMTNNQDINSFESLDTIKPILNGKKTNFQWINIDYLFKKYQGKGKYIAFRVSNAINSTYRIDEVTLSVAPNCVAPTSLSVTNIKTDGADISWTEIGTAESWTLEYGLSGFSAGTGTSIKNLTNTNYTLTGLERGKTYDIYVYSHCDENTISEPSLVKTFTCDMCEPEDKCTYIFNLSSPFTYGWDGCSIKVYINGEYQQDITITQAGVKSVSYDVAICNDVEVAFAFKKGTYFRNCSFSIIDPNGETIVACVNGKLQEPFIGDVSAFDSYDRYLYKGRTSCTPASCARPQETEAANVTARTAIIHWKAGGSETSWNVKLCKKGTTDALKSDIVEDNPVYYLEDLTPETEYDFLIQAVCGPEGNSQWALCNFTTPASCPMPAELHPNDEFVTAHEIPLLWVKGDGEKWQVLVYTPETFGERKPIFDTIVTEPHYTVTNLEPASVYMFEVVTLCADGETSVPAMFEFMTFESCLFPTDLQIGEIEATAAHCTWVPRGEETQWEFQYKKNTDMEYVSEIVESPEYQLKDLDPNTSYDTRIRALCDGGEYSAWISKSFTTERIPCAEPSDLSFSNITNYSAIANWKAEGTAKEWNVQYKEHTTDLWNSLLLSNETTCTFSKLKANTQYNVRIQSVCGINYNSEWIYGDFKTMEEDTCTRPTHLQVSEVSTTSATITWEQADEDTHSWTVHQREQGATNWKSSDASEKQVELTELTPNTTYEIEVIANCDNGTVSYPTDIVTFTTKPDAISDYILNSNINMYPNPTTGTINCTVSGELNIHKIEVYDIYGKLLMTRDESDTTFCIDATHLADGMYFIRICTDKGNAQKAFIKKQ